MLENAGPLKHLKHFLNFIYKFQNAFMIACSNCKIEENCDQILKHYSIWLVDF